MKPVSFIALQAASEAFSGERLPDNWESLSEDDQNDWLESNKWAAVENESNDEFWNLIENHASTIEGAIKDSLGVLHKKLIQKAMDDKLPDDFNDLDLEYILFEE